MRTCDLNIEAYVDPVDIRTSSYLLSILFLIICCFVKKNSTHALYSIEVHYTLEDYSQFCSAR